MPRVLVTKKLTKPQQNLILNLGWSYVMYAAIETKAIHSTDFFTHFSAKNVIVTSPFVASLLVANRPSIKQLFVVGQKTTQQLEKMYQVQEVANYGVDLAKKICSNYMDESFVYLSGNLRKDELPQMLKEKQVQMEEHVVYATEASVKAIPGFFDAVIFCSPSAVTSFFKANSAHPDTTYICIGKTSALAVARCTQNFLIASKPSVENCIAKLAQIKST